MTPIDLPPLIDQLLRAGAALMISISGGKDSQAMLKALFRAYKERGWTGPLLAIHAHLGRMEWPETLGKVHRQCNLLGIDLLIVERPQGDFLDLMIDRMQTVAGQDVPFWPSSSARYCTSDMKRAQIDKKLRAYEIVISAKGVRGEESPKRAKKPIRMTREEIMMENLATSQNVLCTLATYVRKIAELKAEKPKVKLLSGVGSTTFDRSTGEYVVTFAESIGEVL